MIPNPFKSFQILKERPILLLWLGQLLSAFGDRFFEIAIVWLSVQIIGSEAGFVLVASSLARLIMGFLGGVYADRWNRQSIMISVDVLRALAVFSLPIAAMTADITLIQLAIVAALTGGLSSIFDPALTASLPALSKDSSALQASNALLDITSRMARIFAPGLAGFLVGVLPVAQFFTLDALSFLISAIAVFMIGKKFAWQPERQAKNSKGLISIFDDIWGAMKLVQQNRGVFWSLLSYVPANIVWSAVFMVGLALYADDVLGVGVRGYSFMITAYGIGSVLSNMIVAGMNIKNRPRFLFAGVIIFALGFIFLAQVDSLTLALACMFFMSLGTPMSDLTVLLMIQKEFPENQIGKIFSLRLTISSLGFSLGLVLASPLFKYMSSSTGFMLCGILLFVVGIAGFLRFRKTTPLF